RTGRRSTFAYVSPARKVCARRALTRRPAALLLPLGGQDRHLPDGGASDRLRVPFPTLRKQGGGIDDVDPDPNLDGRPPPGRLALQRPELPRRLVHVGHLRLIQSQTV